MRKIMALLLVVLLIASPASARVKDLVWTVAENQAKQVVGATEKGQVALVAYQILSGVSPQGIAFQLACQKEEIKNACNVYSTTIGTIKDPTTMLLQQATSKFSANLAPAKREKFQKGMMVYSYMNLLRASPSKKQNSITTAAVALGDDEVGWMDVESFEFSVEGYTSADETYLYWPTLFANNLDEIAEKYNANDFLFFGPIVIKVVGSGWKIVQSSLDKKLELVAPDSFSQAEVVIHGKKQILSLNKNSLLKYQNTELKKADIISAEEQFIDINSELYLVQEGTRLVYDNEELHIIPRPNGFTLRCLSEECSEDNKLSHEKIIGEVKIKDEVIAGNNFWIEKLNKILKVLDGKVKMDNQGYLFFKDSFFEVNKEGRKYSADVSEDSSKNNFIFDDDQLTYKGKLLLKQGDEPLFESHALDNVIKLGLVNGVPGIISLSTKDALDIGVLWQYGKKIMLSNGINPVIIRDTLKPRELKGGETIQLLAKRFCSQHDLDKIKRQGDAVELPCINTDVNVNSNKGLLSIANRGGDLTLNSRVRTKTEIPENIIKLREQILLSIKNDN